MRDLRGGAWRHAAATRGTRRSGRAAGPRRRPPATRSSPRRGPSPPAGAVRPSPPLRRERAPGPRVLAAASLGAGMIIGTAGHIDHGKSALVAALTGQSMDRLAEER